MDIRKYKLIGRISGYLLVIITIMFIFFKYITPIAFNYTESIPVGIYVVDKFNKEYKKGDYVVYKLDDDYIKYIPKEARTFLVAKKIVAVKGDKIEKRNNKIFINDIKVVDYINQNIKSKFKDKVLDKHEFLTLSNNINSLDGRYYGNIRRKQILYKIHLIYEIK